jgi:glyoxylase-like metal-dependent hydrolase (beta-lactamase superfamily II)
VAPEWFGATSQLAAELAAVGIRPSDIDLVVITHVHDDHMGGTVTAARELAFPNARHLVHRADLEWQRGWAERDDEERLIYDTLLLPLEEAGLLVAVDGDSEIAEGIRLRHAPGHTPGHQMVQVGGAGGRALISGDAFNHPLQISEPGWHGSSDDDPGLASSTRRALLDEIAGGHVLLAPSHFAEAFGRVEPDNDGRPHWVPA